MAGLAWLTWGRLGALQKMDLNEIGDFMAGAFGPLAILWLVLGYFQQGIELRQNSNALQMQADELANSVQQQAELVAVSKAQLQYEKDIFAAQQAEARHLAEQQSIRMRPKYRLSYVSRRGHVEPHLVVNEFRLLNVGHACTDIHLRLDAERSIITSSNLSGLEKMKSATINLNSHKDAHEVAILNIQCTDGLGEEFTKMFSIEMGSSGIKINEAD